MSNKTDRLYYQDPGLCEFEAEIVTSDSVEGRWHTQLDRSAFYPTSGGQAHDTGLLNGIKVVDVLENSEGEVIHVTRDQVGKVGTKLRGIVDEERRWHFRRLHTAQHILSQAFLQVAEGVTVSVHLGDEYGAVELDCSRLDEAQVAAAEELAMSTVLLNLPIDILFVDSSELRNYPMRKIPKRDGEIRLIRMGDFECSACGGTHCNSTAEVGPLKIIGLQKIRGHMLVKYLCGRQAFADYSARFKATAALSRELTCGVDELVESFSRLAEKNKVLRLQAAELNRELLPSRASKLAEKSMLAGDVKLVCAESDIGDSKLANQLAMAVADIVGGVVVLVEGDRVLLATHSECGYKAGDLAKLLGEKTGLKGGGNARAAQLGGADELDINRCRELILEILSE